MGTMKATFYPRVWWRKHHPETACGSAALKGRIANLIRQDVNVITLLALSDEGQPSYDNELAADFAALGCPVFACTPDQFPDLMATALKREDVLAWAADQDIKAVRAAE